MKHLFAFIIISFSMTAYSQDDSSFHETLNKFTEEEKAEILLGAGNPVNLFNFVTGETETIQRIDKVSAEKFAEFVPPLEEAQAMYQLFLAHGLVPYEAYSQTMAQLMIVLSEG